MLLLTADIGGTKSRLQLSRLEGDGCETLCRESYVSSHYNNFKEIVDAFLATYPVSDAPSLACLAVAGPVTGKYVELTNLPWKIDAKQLSAALKIDQITLVNDVEAAAYGVDCLSSEDFRLIKEGKALKNAPRAVINIGTGFSHAALISCENQNKVLVAEGGHIDFAPVNGFGMSLLGNLLMNREHVSIEMVLSGLGLVNIFDYVSSLEQFLGVDAESDRLKSVTTSEIIAKAKSGNPAALETINQFMELLANHIANVALMYLARGGVYLVGGLLPSMMEYLSRDNFVKSFTHKKAMSHILEKIPVQLVLNEDVGLIGAEYMGRLLYKNSC